jgi:hypothetical protein
VQHNFVQLLTIWETIEKQQLRKHDQLFNQRTVYGKEQKLMASKEKWSPQETCQRSEE